MDANGKRFKLYSKRTEWELDLEMPFGNGGLRGACVICGVWSPVIRI